MKKILSLFFAISLIFTLAFSLTSCAKPNSDPDAAVAALEAANYEDVSKGYSASWLDIEDLDCRVSAIKTENGLCEWIEIYYFPSSAAANAAWEELQKEADSWFVNADPDDYGSRFVCKKSGSMVYFGTKNGVKDAQ